MKKILIFLTVICTFILLIERQPKIQTPLAVYDLEKEEYLYASGLNDEEMVASIAKLFVIDYALTKVNLEEIVHVDQKLLDLVPSGSSLAHLSCGTYTTKQLIEAMLVPSGNDAAYALASYIGQKELGKAKSHEAYIQHFMGQLDLYLKCENYSNTHLYNNPSGASNVATTKIDDVLKVSQKLLNYDFIKNCMSKHQFSINTPQGILKWKNTNECLNPNSQYYNKDIKGIKTGTFASNYNLVVLYKHYIIICLGAKSNDERYQTIHYSINSIIEN